MAILPTLDPASPDDDPATFDTKEYAFQQALATTWKAAFEAAIQALNLNATTDTSSTSNSIGLGAKSFVASPSKSFVPGMYVVAADTAAPATNSMFGQVTSYDIATGALAISVTSFAGSGTKTAWTISQSSAVSAAVGDSAVVLNTPNGYGSTNNMIARFTTLQSSSGADLTYADSATLGASITVVRAGLFLVTFQGPFGATAALDVGASLNTTTPTTGINSIASTQRIMTGQWDSTVRQLGTLQRVIWCNAGDVIRPHTNGLSLGTSVVATFSVRKVGA